MRPSGQLTVIALSLSLTGTASAELQGRIPATPGESDYQAYYDDQLDITWLSDAALSGTANWNNQLNWATTFISGGIDGWRLPSVDRDGDGTVIECATANETACLDNEYGYMFYHNGITATAPGPFANVSAGVFWSATVYQADPQSLAWSFDFSGGSDSVLDLATTVVGWAVHDGDVAGFDLDGDTVSDSIDNCIEDANPDQRDIDGDGHGSICDADFDNSCLTNFIDLNIMKGGFFGTNPELDLDGSGLVNFADLNLMKAMFFGPPGPSAAGVCTNGATTGTWNDFVWNGAHWQ